MCITSTPLKLTPSPFCVCDTSFFWFPESRTLILIPRSMCYGTGKKDEQGREDSCYLLIETLNTSRCNPPLLVHTVSLNWIYREFWLWNYTRVSTYLNSWTHSVLPVDTISHLDYSSMQRLWENDTFFSACAAEHKRVAIVSLIFHGVKKYKIKAKVVAENILL